MTPWNQLIEGASSLGISLDLISVNTFQKYTFLLQEANTHVNLTAISAIPDIITKLHLDSLSLLPHIAAAAGSPLSEFLSFPWKAADIGSGAGIPGLPILFAWPTLQLTLIESIQKKARFLQTVTSTLGLTVSILDERAETVGQNPQQREQYDLVMARAVAPLSTLVEITLPLARLDGLIALPKGAAVEQEVVDARFATQLLGGDLLSVERVLIPGVIQNRTLVLIRKVRPTPSQFPRRPGLPTKRPLSHATR